MGRHLGKLGTPRAERDDTFDYLDETDVRVHPDITDLLLVEFMRRAGGLDENDPAAMDAMQTMFGTLIHPDDADRFWAAALRNRQTIRDLMGVVFDLVEGLADRPTRRRTGSPPGRRNTAAKSKGDSSSQVIRRLERAGRSDLALVVVQAREARRAG